MKALVTGGTGFIGGNVVRTLLKHDYEVRVLVRPKSSRQALAGKDVELAIGDLTDPTSLEKALSGCDFLFHVAAIYALWTPDPNAVFEANLQGTKNLLEASQKAGIEKVVFTSSESTIGTPRSGGLGHENLITDLEHLPGAYKKSKLLAEQAALSFFEAGLPVVVVNPTTPVGIGDVKPTPTGRIVLDYLNGRMPAFVNTGLNLVDVEDVAEGHVLALEKGRMGERYILGNRNMTLQEVLEMLAHITGRSAPRLRIPFWLATGAAYVDEWSSAHITHRPPRIPLAGVRAARKVRFMDCSKAVKELGLPQSPVEAALEKAVGWFRENGYVENRGSS
jgi:dihydroflavonol-4-reductase